MSRFRRARSRILDIAPSVLVVISLGIVGCGPEDAGQPNLILITADHLPANHLACFGELDQAGRRAATNAGESICRLGEGGTLYGWTMTGRAGAASSAASVLTGLPAAIHRVDDSGLSFLSDSHVTIAERLAAAHYATGAFVENPILNRSRRLDQGFDDYDDRLTDDPDLAARVQRWIASARQPHFVWIQLGSSATLPEIDRLVSRLDAVLGKGSADTGVLFASLRGNEPDETGIRLSTHRVPMIWRAPTSSTSAVRPQASFALASLQDILPTLLASAGIAPLPTAESNVIGLDLDQIERAEEDRFFLLEGTKEGRDVGLASGRTLYVRNKSALDASGQPVPTAALTLHAPRFLTLPLESLSETRSARLPTLNWRDDVLSADSPVPRLEFHLSRKIQGRTVSASE
jgi:hypothetical protein